MEFLRLWAIVLLAGFVLVNCSDNSDYTTENTLTDTDDRSVATVYETSRRVACRESASIDAPVVMYLAKGHTVDLASSIDGAMRSDGHYWVRVYPRLSQSPTSCYATAESLIPRQ